MQLKIYARQLLIIEVQLKIYAMILKKYATLFKYSAMKLEKYAMLWSNHISQVGNSFLHLIRNQEFTVLVEVI